MENNHDDKECTLCQQHPSIRILGWSHEHGQLSAQLLDNESLKERGNSSRKSSDGREVKRLIPQNVRKCN